ncbi:DEAD/DEAH box helicase [Clostridium sp. 19966]|uniref:DEAD/DEAH box helicase n=1 Tax=Clostridium sp. 19966 TaxID=2768166 RepID=UPI0028DDC596|nr:DEAD/DEAH box helicase [Clostridium sp. 19966]MDT8718730.1 DEAD/DEAH box helicase [Clostridium sp. 19966]
MNLKDLEVIIFKNSYSIMNDLGMNLFQNKSVSNIKGKNINGIYHIYGDVTSSNGNLPYKPHIKINLNKKTLAGNNCSCSDFKDNNVYDSNFMCSHLNALAYAFFNIMYRKKSSSNSQNEEIANKITFNVEAFLEYREGSSPSAYQAEFKLLDRQKYLIRDLKTFINAAYKNEEVLLNSQFKYSPKYHTLSEEALILFDFIKNEIYSKELSINGKALYIPKNKLRNFLMSISNNTLYFKYNGISYKTSIIYDKLPLSFTLKEKDDNFILTTHSKLPLPLNELGDVYFFKGNLYIPSIDLITVYKQIYNMFSSANEIKYEKNTNNYEYLIRILNKVSNNINISEGVKKFGSQNIEFQFLLYKELDIICCTPYAICSNKKVNILLESSTPNIVRDFKKEEKLLMKLEYFKFARKNDRMLFWGNDYDLFYLLKGGKNGLSNLGKVKLDKSLESIKLLDASFIDMALEEHNNNFILSYAMKGIPNQEFHEIFQAYKEKKAFYRLSNGNFLDFEDESISNFFNLFLNLSEVSAKENSITISKDKELYLCKGLGHSKFNIVRGRDILEDIDDKIKQIYSSKVLLPKNLETKLKEYQIEGFTWFKRLSALGFGGILADDMGLGKTLQTIAFLSSEKNKKALIIVPTSLIYNWNEEFKKFAPSLRLLIAHKLDSYHKLTTTLQDVDAIITSYGTLRNNIESFKKCAFDFCIVDEAQNIKNSSTSISRLIKEINSGLRFALTGTPIENNLLELWSIFDFIMPEYLYSKENFTEKFVNGDAESLDNLRLLIKPFILRRTKAEVMSELPEKLQRKVIVEMTPMQKQIYASYIKEIKKALKLTKGKIELFAYITKLRQICLDPSLIIHNYSGGSGKITAALDIINNNLKINKKILLFSQFTSALKKIGDELKKESINYFYLDGATDSKARINLVNEFNSTDSTGVFLISLKAGGTGLNLTSANLVILFDPWWNPAVEQQASDRAHRIGQKNVVEVIKLVAKDSIEEKIVALQEQKKELIDSIITGDLKSTTLLNKLTKEELEQLFLRD